MNVIRVIYKDDSYFRRFPILLCQSPTFIKHFIMRISCINHYLILWLNLLRKAFSNLGPFVIRSV